MELAKAVTRLHLNAKVGSSSRCSGDHPEISTRHLSVTAMLSSSSVDTTTDVMETVQVGSSDDAAASTITGARVEIHNMEQSNVAIDMVMVELKKADDISMIRLLTPWDSNNPLLFRLLRKWRYVIGCPWNPGKTSEHNVVKLLVSTHLQCQRNAFRSCNQSRKDETWTDFDGPSWIQYDLFHKNKLPGSKKVNLAKFMLPAQPKLDRKRMNLYTKHGVFIINLLCVTITIWRPMN